MAEGCERKWELVRELKEGQINLYLASVLLGQPKG